MTTNAPYYQMRRRPTDSTNAPQTVPDDDNDDPSPATVTPRSPSSLRTERQTSADRPISALEQDHNLAELLVAATNAAEPTEQAMDAHNAVGVAPTAPNKGKRKRLPSPWLDEDERAASHGHGNDTSGTKRARIDIDPRLQGTDNSSRGRSESSSVLPSSESLLNDAGAAGVHSAAVLFRHPSERATRKSTRMPMSTLFMSLQLTPENFLRLQAQAKAYMLDPMHPERQNCVGNRAKGDSDMVKLRLFNCVRDFLNDGAGEQFFGVHVKKPGHSDVVEAARALGEQKSLAWENNLVWPRDGNTIIGLVTPLMRRMVTNEKQRKYAIEARSKKKEGDVGASFDTSNTNSLVTTQSQYGPSHPTSPTSSVSTSQAIPPILPMAPSDQINLPTSGEMQARPQKQLPTRKPNEPIIQLYNIFLSKNELKINEKRIDCGNTGYYYPWDELLQDINFLVKDAYAMYPELREEAKGIESTREALRGLAVAASKIESANAASNESTRALGPTSRGNLPEERVASTSNTTAIQSTLAPPLALPNGIQLEPRYTIRIKAMSSVGPKEISNPEDWQQVKLDLAYAIWADHVCSVVVELV